MLKMREIIRTPWGIADAHKRYGVGVNFYSTPSHGGFLLSPARRQAMPQAIREFRTFAGGNWYEEDFDAMLVVYSFPELFLPEDLESAIAGIRAIHPELLPVA